MESVAESRSEPGELSGKRTAMRKASFTIGVYPLSQLLLLPAEESAKALSDLPAVPKIIPLAANESLFRKVTETSKDAGRGDSGRPGAG